MLLSLSVGSYDTGPSRAWKSGWQALKVSTPLGRRERRARTREHGYVHAQFSTSLASLFAGGGIGGGGHDHGYLCRGWRPTRTLRAGGQHAGRRDNAG